MLGEKQVLHLLTLDERKKFYHDIKNHINEDANIVFIHMNDQTEIPLFPLMENKLQQSLKSHKILLEELTQKFNLLKMLNFNYHVKISLEEYLEMISNRYMTVLLDLSKKEIEESGIESSILNRVIKLIDFSEYKRRQAPLGVKITARGFGKDRRYPITNKFLK